MTDWTAPLPQLPEVDEIATRVEADDNVQGVLLTGAFAHGMGTEESNIDLHVLVAERDDSWRTRSQGRVDLSVMDMRRLATPPSDPGNWWGRYRVGRGKILFDRTEGTIPDHLGRWHTLTPAEKADAVDYYLEPYLTYSTRSMRAFDAREMTVSHLDASEALPWAMRLVFALQSRVRPTNRYLAWDLEHHPLTQPPMPGDRLMALVEDITTRGSVPAQRALFAFLEPQLRSAGFGGAMDTFPAGLARLRG